jgi:uncharacterized protein YbbC (DUF1343 family)
MHKITQIFLFLFCILQYACSSADFTLGIQRTNQYFPVISDKKIGVVANQTSMLQSTHLVDTLLASGLDVVRVFSPEHGFRGKADAGAHIENGVDNKTGLPIISLYGSNKKPTVEQLQGIDVLIFDIQDVGARFYTYISTLHYVMEAAAQNNIPLIVLDRPNPNASYVDGPVLDTAYRSFVGMHPIPIVHGMTIGEYAQMINGQKWLQDSLFCELTIVGMENYNHQMAYDLPIKPSPNLPNAISIALYPSLCLFEGTTVSVGRGTDIPFQHYGAPFLESVYSFVPKSGPGSKYPKHENVECYGADLRNDTIHSLQLQWLIAAYNQSPDQDNFFNSFFDKLAGGSELREQIIAGKSQQQIKESWQADLQDFMRMRSVYLLYE